MQPILKWRNMLKRILTTFLCAIVITPLMAEDVIYMTTELFRDRIFDYKTEREWKYKGDQPCVIDFYTTWCGPCKRLAPIMEELSQQYCGEVMFYKADTERERELAYVFNISSIPQVLYIPMDGRPILLKGLYPKEEIVKIIDEFLLAPRPEAQPVLIAEPQPESVVEAQPEPEKEQRKSIWEKWKERLKGKKK